MESGRQGSLQSRHRASLMSTKMLFELSPATFDGIEVGRIGWQGGEPGTGGLDPRADPLDLVSRQIVHDYHLARPELRAQHLFQIGEKDIAIGRGFDGHGATQPLRLMAPSTGLSLIHILTLPTILRV